MRTGEIAPEVERGMSMMINPSGKSGQLFDDGRPFTLRMKRKRPADAEAAGDKDGAADQEAAAQEAADAEKAEPAGDAGDADEPADDAE